ncbi:hypothetical protein FKM82_001834, partial [Ascaphus truei]
QTDPISACHVVLCLLAEFLGLLYERESWGFLLADLIKIIKVQCFASLLVVDAKDPPSLPMVTENMESKENGSVDVKNSVENGRPPDPAHWAVDDVVSYFRTAGFEEQASAFQDQEIDGKSLLLMTRNDVLTGLSLKLGPALKMYEYHVKPLQTQHLKNNSS